MITLSKGFKLPETGDFGDVWFPALEDNIQQLNDHKHDGLDSEKIPSGNLSASVVTTLVGAFADQGDGYWRASVSTPGGVALSDLSVTVRDPTTLEPIYAKLAKNTASSIYVYINTPQTVEVVFGV